MLKSIFKSNLKFLKIIIIVSMLIAAFLTWTTAMHNSQGVFCKYEIEENGEYRKVKPEEGDWIYSDRSSCILQMKPIRENFLLVTFLMMFYFEVFLLCALFIIEIFKIIIRRIR